MYFFRQTQLDELDTVLKLAKMVHFINLPADRDIIAEKILRSRLSFKAAVTGEAPKIQAAGGSPASSSPIYMLSLIDSESNTCHGTSTIIAHMGGKGNPNLSFQVAHKNFFSRDLGQGTTHTVLRLFLDERGPTEIGGLILTPSLRRHPARLGKQLSLVRFHFMGLHPELFSEHILAEMMAPLTPDGRSVFWDALGRKFINLSYTEADMFCQHSREFMLSLLPREDLYVTLLPPEARAVIGQVGADTRPAHKMLTDIGFKATDRVDPFDAGPHIEANLNDISLVRDTQPDIFAGYCTSTQAKARGFISVLHEDGQYRAIHSPYMETESGGRAVKLPKEAAQVLMLEAGMPIGVTPFDLENRPHIQTRKPSKPKRRARV